MKTNFRHAVPLYTLSFILAFSLCLPTAGLAYASPDDESVSGSHSHEADTAQTSSPCIPSDEDIAKWEADGTLDDRIAFQESLGNGEVSSSLIAQAQQRANGSRMLRSSSGNNLPSAEAGRVSMNTVGDAKVIALLVDFPLYEGSEEYLGFDESGDTLKALQALIGSPLPTSNPEDTERPDYTNSAFYPYNSLNAYYARSSYGKLNLTGTAFKYKADHPRSYYTDNINALFAEALHYLDDKEDVNFAEYDPNNDGYIDAVYLHFAGGEAQWGTTWWSNRNFYSGTKLDLDGKNIGSTITLHLPSNSEDGIRTAIHETGHALGLPDYYSYYPESTSPDRNGRTGILTFDMMNTNLGDHNAFSKWLLGWIGDSEITRIVANEEGIVKKDASGTTTIAPDELGNSSTESTLSLLSTETIGDCGGFIAVSNDKSLLEPAGLLSSFYMLEYNSYAGNQIVSYQKEAEREPIPTGFRLFRIQADIVEDPSDGLLRFVHENRYDDAHNQFIELVDADSSLEHIEYIGSAPGSGKPYYGCMLMAGDEVTPLGSTSNGEFGDYPTTNFLENINAGFTGLSFKVEQSGPEKGIVRVSYSLENEPSISSDSLVLTQSEPRGIDSTDVIELKANIPLTRSYNSEAAHLEVDGKTAHVLIENLTHNTITISYDLPPDLFKPNATCELVFPEGYFFIGINEDREVYSNEIRISLRVGNVAKIDNKGIYANAVSDTCNSSSIVTTQDGSSHFALIDKGEVRLCTVDKTDPTTVNARPINGLDETDAISIHLIGLADNKLNLIVSAYKRDLGYISSAYWIDPSISSVESRMELPPTHLSSFEAIGSNGNGLVVSYFVGDYYSKYLMVELYDPEVDQHNLANSWLFSSVESVHTIANADGKLALKGTTHIFGSSNAKIIDVSELSAYQQGTPPIDYSEVDCEITLNASTYSEISGFALSDGNYLALASIAPEAAGSPDLTNNNSGAAEEAPAWRGRTDLKGYIVSFDQNGEVSSSFLFGTYPMYAASFNAISISPNGIPAAEITLDAADYGSSPRRILFFKDGINTKPITLTYDSTAFGAWLHNEAWLEIDFDRSYSGDAGLGGEGEGIGGVGSPDLSGEGLGEGGIEDGFDSGDGMDEGDDLIGGGYEEQSRAVHYLLAFLPSDGGEDGGSVEPNPDPVPGSGSGNTLSNTGDATGLMAIGCAVAAIAAIVVAVLAFRASRKKR